MGVQINNMNSRYKKGQFLHIGDFLEHLHLNVLQQPILNQQCESIEDPRLLWRTKFLNSDSKKVTK